MNKPTKLPVDSLTLSIVETCRSYVRNEAVERYKNVLENAGKRWPFPPLVVWQDDQKNYLLDGHHRLLAAKGAALYEVPVILKDFANVSEAHRFALYINSTHGERLTREETRENIRSYLQNGGAIESDTAIANLFGVSRIIVSDVRANRDGMTKKEKVAADVAKVLADNPHATITEIAEKVGVSRATAKKASRRIEEGEVKKMDGVVTDCFGREVPQNNIDKLMKIKSALKGCTASVNDLSVAIDRLKDVGGFARTSEVEMAMNALAQIRHIFKQRRPDALCTCRGDGCRKCGGVGFLEKTMFNVIVPDSDK